MAPREVLARHVQKLPALRHFISHSHFTSSQASKPGFKFVLFFTSWKYDIKNDVIYAEGRAIHVNE